MKSDLKEHRQVQGHFGTSVAQLGLLSQIYKKKSILKKVFIKNQKKTPFFYSKYS